VVGIVIDYDLVTIPKPAVAESIVSRCHVEIKAVKKEAFAVTALEPEHMFGSEAAVEVAVLPWMVKVISGVISACFMADPLTIRVYVGRFGVTWLIGEFARAFGVLFLAAGGGWAMRGRVSAFRMPTVFSAVLSEEWVGRER
jgi:hypothetical protein